MGGSETARLLVERAAGGVARLTLNRPEVHNAFDDALIAELDSAFMRIDDDAAVRAVVLAANGKSFSAGADLTWMRRVATYSHAENVADAIRLTELLRRIAGLSKPVIALVQGAAYGGGVGLVAACDIAIASEAASFMLSEVKLGLIPAVISPYVVRAIGARQARRYFISAERIDAAQAQRLGLVHEVVGADALEDAGARMLERLAANGRRAMAAAKDLVDAVADRPIDRAVMEDTARRIADARAGAEGREGIAAFLDKRKPGWHDG
jgi:methylglutaconyl-CoA hydratase